MLTWHMRIRDSGRRLTGTPLAALAAGAALLCAPAWSNPPPAGPAAGGGEPAVWVPKELKFVYKGFTTHYSCDGLQTKMTNLLLKLGARRQDLHVRNYDCASWPGVAIRMSVLQPAAGQTGGETVPAQWKTVDLLAHPDPFMAAADCDLLGEVRQQVVPLFATRHIDFSAVCEKRQLVLGGTHLKLDVLVPEEGAAPRAAAR
jgi:hypothetical protein